MTPTLWEFAWSDFYPPLAKAGGDFFIGRYWLRSS
jgi:hypothetical protein